MRQEFIETKLKEKYGDSEGRKTLTADEMSQFYKGFLDDHLSLHTQYNKEWYWRNGTNILLAARVWLQQKMSRAPPLPSHSKGAGHTPTPTSHCLSGAPPLPSHGEGAGHTPTSTSHCLSGAPPLPSHGEGAGHTPTPTSHCLRGAALALTRGRGGTHANTHESLSLSGAPPFEPLSHCLSQGRRPLSH
ncbi:Apoptogenic protein 1, mitochondrial [Chionoecetes opilio]|uniref:Apoptogenic protein 1, mitochondrial n=1 Tax=Chionoecetes opilio TaxID=41210 RepID=A0A8J5C398_CHIOP|nr:Apoptogenic protein 1, mitochondrial [Chionoecetes opilio]